MPLFQKSVLNKFIKSQDNVKIETAYQRFSDIFLNEKRQAEIRSMKEEEYQDGFLNDLFIKILGYVIRPNDGYNLVREKKNEADSKKADGAILKNDSPLAVIELKGTDTTDLDKVTPQGFGYKNNHKECVYVVISNFEKLRFFIHHAVDYIEFNLFTLTKEEFTTLWLCLHSDNFLDNIPAKIKAESVVKEEDITKNLYKDYSTFKKELWQDIVRLNPNGDPLNFYKKTQKLIDRFLFIFFAEDAGLLPPNSISRMVDRWKMLKEEDAYKPLYEIFKQYFGYINTGRKGKTPQDDIFAYNGGLMAEDEVLETISISDDVLLKHVSRLTTYDFSSEVDVNILGHIFENSLNDIEAVTAELEGQEIDKSKTKRKKDGVFYTPKYITKYIVDNTVGKLCDEKKSELNIIDEEYAKGRTNRKKETLKQLDENLQAYRNWLLNITICDPACGSGAFLNQALEYLMEEHRYIDELESQLLGAGFTFPGVENHILENNIFGVDINEESIEIAKLSLWLRTAQRGRKLTSLNNNIKCGNSLIDDPEIAGDKAFNWQQEFPTVFKEKNKFPFHITTSIHDSRTSERMIKYKARERRFDGTKPDPEVFPMTKEEEELIASTVAEIAKEDNLNIAAFNLCWDHMHILLVCEEDEVPRIMHKIKGRTARACNVLRNKGNTLTKGINPLDDNPLDDNPLDDNPLDDNPLDDIPLDTMRKDGSMPFWTQKYGCKPITSDDQFWNTYNYIENNKVKHNLPKNPKLENIILGFVKTYEDCFKPEYTGGFDVVIGNPPYGILMDKKTQSFYNINFPLTSYKTNLYVLFIERMLQIFECGVVHFIIPKSLLFNSYYDKIRKELILKTEINEILTINEEVFEDAEVGGSLLLKFTMKNGLHDKNKINLISATKINEFVNWNGLTKNSISQGDFLKVPNCEISIISEDSSSIINKLNKLPQIKENYSLKNGLNPGNIKDILISDIKESENHKKIIWGKDISKYNIAWSGQYIEYDKNIVERISLNDIKSKQGMNKQNKIDFALRSSDLFENRKVLIRKTGDSLIAALDQNNYYFDTLVHGIYQKSEDYSLESLLCILNSKPATTIYRMLHDIKGKIFAKISLDNLSSFPIPKLTIDINKQFISLAKKRETYYLEFLSISKKFTTYFSSYYLIVKPSTKLSSWHELDFSEFIKELSKAIKASGGTPLTKKDEFEWMELFEENKKKALELKSQIDQTDKEIDRMVYKLYGLTEEEIQIVENS